MLFRAIPTIAIHGTADKTLSDPRGPSAADASWRFFEEATAGQLR